MVFYRWIQCPTIYSLTKLECVPKSLLYSLFFSLCLSFCFYFFIVMAVFLYIRLESRHLSWCGKHATLIIFRFAAAYFSSFVSWRHTLFLLFRNKHTHTRACVFIYNYGNRYCEWVMCWNLLTRFSVTKIIFLFCLFCHKWGLEIYYAISRPSVLTIPSNDQSFIFHLFVSTFIRLFWLIQSSKSPIISVAVLFCFVLFMLDWMFHTNDQTLNAENDTTNSP